LFGNSKTVNTQFETTTTAQKNVSGVQ